MPATAWINADAEPDLAFLARRPDAPYRAVLVVGGTPAHASRVAYWLLEAEVSWSPSDSVAARTAFDLVVQISGPGSEPDGWRPNPSKKPWGIVASLVRWAVASAHASRETSAGWTGSFVPRLGLAGGAAR